MNRDSEGEQCPVASGSRRELVVEMSRMCVWVHRVVGGHCAVQVQFQCGGSSLAGPAGGQVCHSGGARLSTSTTNNNIN